jgi:hypothetical protein
MTVSSDLKSYEVEFDHEAVAAWSAGGCDQFCAGRS